ncbi:MAG: site-2 protease family protein [Deltaproteobacteria bacterium]|nr:site-2 protease family protein [Deltaproteobacteria bacterium]
MFNLDPLTLLLLIPPILFALTAHECAHAWVADRLGDNTAKMLGRITLNPLKHLDPIGTLAIFLTGLFGWARPVPVNPRNFRHPTRDMMWVSIAGPMTNLFLAAIFALIVKALIFFGGPSSFGGTLYEPLITMAYISVRLNIALAIFNMIPVPPLDGSKALFHFLPPRMAISYMKYEHYGFLILMLMIFSGASGYVLIPIVNFTTNILL